MRIFLFISILITMLFGFSSASISQEKTEVDPIAELEAVSNYFHNIDIGQYDCDIKTIFDLSRQYDKEDIEKWELAKGTYVFLGNYHYEEGGKFFLDVFGERVAQNDASTDVVSQSIVVPMLPLPGGIMYGNPGQPKLLLGNWQYDALYRCAQTGSFLTVAVPGGVAKHITLLGDKTFWVSISTGEIPKAPIPVVLSDLDTAGNRVIQRLNV